MELLVSTAGTGLAEAAKRRTLAPAHLRQSTNQERRVNGLDEMRYARPMNAMNTKKAAGAHLPYEMGNSGDLIKHGVLAEYVRWRHQSGSPVRFIDLFGGEPDERMVQAAGGQAGSRQRKHRVQALHRLFDLFDGNDAAAEVHRLKREDDGWR